MIDRSRALPLARQVAVLKLSRSHVYCQPRSVSPGDLAIMWRIDELPLDQRRILQVRTSVGPERTRQFPVSALSGEGVDQLLQAIEDRLGGQSAAREVTVPLSDGATIAWLYRHGDVRSRQDEGEVARLTVALDAAATAQFERRLAR